MNSIASARVLLCLLLPNLLPGYAVSQVNQVDPLSATSLEIKILHDDKLIGTATGFVVDKHNKHYLVTNRHVVLACGLDPDPTDVGGWMCANKLAIFHNRLDHDGQWFWVTENLLDEHGKAKWFEHPTLAGRADLVAIPLAQTDNVRFNPLDLELRKTDMRVGPGDSVSIVGFPFGRAQGAGLAIWKTGTVASDLSVDYNGRPMFLMDTTSRPGMSGSPVYAVRSGAFAASGGRLMSMSDGTAKKFLGVYSEQDREAEVGGVWKAEALVALYDSLP